MRTSDRILLVLIGLLDIFAGVYAALDLFTGLWKSKLGFILYRFFEGPLSVVMAVFVMAVLLIVGTSLIVISANSHKYRRVKRNDVVTILDGENGKARVTFEAVRSIAKKKCMTFRTVSDCMTDVNFTSGVLSVEVRVKPFANVSLTNLAKDIQQGVKESIAEQTGLSVGSVSVLMLPSEKKKEK